VGVSIVPASILVLPLTVTVTDPGTAWAAFIGVPVSFFFRSDTVHDFNGCWYLAL
jgi:hypothetical protein